MANFIDGLAKLLKDKFQFKADVLKSVKEVRVGETNTTSVTNNLFFIGKEDIKDPQIIAGLQNILAGSIKPETKEAYFSTNDSLQRLEEVSTANNESPEIDFFNGKIHEEDFIILQVANLVDKLYREGNRTDADRIKYEAIKKNGTLAKNIINIYGAGYFGNTLKPLYEILQESGSSDFAEKFNEMYRIIVAEAIFTLFVSTTQTSEQALVNLREKIEINRAYGAYKINIHGINKENVKKIRKLIDEIRNEIEGEPVIIISGQAIMVKLTLKKQDGDPKPVQNNDLVSIV